MPMNNKITSKESIYRDINKSMNSKKKKKKKMEREKQGDGI
jgi:hypothetical protein